MLLVCPRGGCAACLSPQSISLRSSNIVVITVVIQVFIARNDTLTCIDAYKRYLPLPLARFRLQGALRAARTYFLSHAVLPALEALRCPAQSEERQEAEDELASRWTNEDARALMLLYLSLMDATRAAIRHWCLHPAADPHSARDAAVEALEASAASRGCSGAIQVTCRGTSLS